MRRRSHELTAQEALSDPLVQSMMTADGVDPRELEALLRRLARIAGRNGSRRRDATRAACVFKRALMSIPSFRRTGCRSDQS